MAHDDAQMAYDQAESAKNQSERIRIELQELILAITEFLEQHGARPEDIRTVCTLLSRGILKLRSKHLYIAA